MRVQNCDGRPRRVGNFCKRIVNERGGTESWNSRRGAYDGGNAATRGGSNGFYQRQSRRSPVDPLESSYRRYTNDVGNTLEEANTYLDLAFSRFSFVRSRV